MKPSPDELGELLRSLPPRSAPRTLETRVLAEIARRGSPWWRRSYAGWPAPVRVAFVLLSGAAAAGLLLALWTAGHRAQGLDLAGEVSRRAGWLDLFPAVARDMADAASAAFAAIPLDWLYAAAAILAAGYAAIAGMTAVAYRTVSSRR